MGINFPNNPLQGALYTPAGGYQYVYLDGVWRVVESPQSVGTAQARSRIVNGAMQISQENGDTSGQTGWYPADQWLHVWSGISTTLTGRQSGQSGIQGSRNIYTQTGAATSSLPAGAVWDLRTAIEGVRVRDFQYGSASARQSILRFTVWTANAPGTYVVRLYNSANDRTYLAAFPVTTTPTDITLVIPGDTTGTWLIDTGIGMQILFSFAAGSTYLGVPGWQAGDKRTVAGATNGAAVANAIFYLTNVGLYLDPLATGVAPRWEMPDEAQELEACQRYWQKYDNIQMETSATSTTMLYPIAFRIPAAVTGGGAGFTVYANYTTHLHMYQTTKGFQNIIFSARM
jgi:hypothetical protein